MDGILYRVSEKTANFFVTTRKQPSRVYGPARCVVTGLGGPL